MFTDTPLSDTDRKAIHDFALEARDRLVTETRDLLEGVYGLTANGALAPLSKLPNLINDPEGKETYRRLNQFLSDEVKAGLERREAVDKLVKEVAFTHLNRLVAFKMLEARKLIRTAVGKGKESNGFKFYLADHPEEEQRWRSGDRGADTAYRHFLLWQCAQVAREVKVLFDPETLPSRLFPRPTALRDLLDLLNAEPLTPAWASAETIGWVYQYFNERELQAAFAAARTQGVKFEAADIPSVTQLFTQRWIVRLLVENTLGRVWMELHPDSRLKDELRYLVPLEKIEPQRREEREEENGKEVLSELPAFAVKKAKDITLLDPACGTMHFGLVAFDLFAAMYREELERAGQAGWPATPSVAAEADIPAAILAHNLYGIDIDLRAVQLSALTLYLKAKELNKDAALTASNLACADVLALNGERLNAFIKEMNFERPAYERLIRALWTRLKDINQLGSLLRLEAEIEELVAEERERFAREGKQPDLFGERARFETEAAEAEYWSIVGGQLIQAFDEFARRAAARGADETFFAGEAAKGLRVLDVMLRRYDCVTTNPPYMSRRKMNDTLAGLLDGQYPEGKDDLYAAFIQRVLEFAGEHGYMGMLTMHSFMFISSYERLRQLLTGQMAIEVVAHLGGGLFATGNPGTLQTVAFILRRQRQTEQRETHEGVYFRLVHEPDSDSKQAAFERTLADGSNSYRVQQSQFKAIPGEPWVYWISNTVMRLFDDNMGTLDQFPIDMGLKTSGNTRFVRWWWEIAPRTRFDVSDRANAIASDVTWFPYAKGAAKQPWSSKVWNCVNWRNDGQELKSHLLGKYPYLKGNTAWCTHNEDLYFKPAVVWKTISSGSFTASLTPAGTITSNANYGIFPSKELSVAVLGILNSSLARYLLSIISPTINFNKGEVEQLPIPDLNKAEKLTRLALSCLYLTQLQHFFVEQDPNFIIPLSLVDHLPSAGRANVRLAVLQDQINDEVYRLYKISYEDQAAIEAELKGDDEGRSETMPIMASDGGESDNQDDDDEEADETTATMTRQELAVRWVSYAIGIALGRFQSGAARALGSAICRRNDFAISSLPALDEAEFNELVGGPEHFAYIDAEGGRHVFSAEVEAKLRALADADGITVLDEGHLDDLPRKVETALELMLGEQATVDVISEIGGDPSAGRGLRRFLERDFFSKWHVRWYRKRPIYWLLQSPKKLYGLYLFHERITKDTLFVVQRKYLDAKVKLTKQLLAEAKAAAKAEPNARERRALNKQADELEKLLADLDEFAKRLKAITDKGYDPDINDGVILNLAPLAEVLPAWSKEPQKYWEGLERGDYDWAHLAMKYWPQRVKAKCKTDKSLAIAHGLA